MWGEEAEGIEECTVNVASFPDGWPDPDPGIPAPEPPLPGDIPDNGTGSGDDGGGVDLGGGGDGGGGGGPYYGARRPPANHRPGAGLRGAAQSTLPTRRPPTSRRTPASIPILTPAPPLVP